MAGTIFGVPLSQRIDSNGKPSVGWLVYIYTQNSSTPVNTYFDTALTVQNPWPLAADSNGTMPPFWVADGAYRCRATSADGSITYFDLTSVLAIGPSSGSAPSGGVDPTAIFQTGDVMWLDFQGTRTGWVRDNGRTIGSSTSGASERANADCQTLFLYLWNNYSDTFCPVAGGRGGSAASDWGSNKKITLPDKRGYIPGGLDDMGNSAASAWTSVPVITGAVTTASSQIGENTHTLAKSEIPTGLHTLTDPGHVHNYAANTVGTGTGTGTVVASVSNSNTQVSVLSHTTGVTINDLAGGGLHNTAQKTVLGTFYRKL